MGLAIRMSASAGEKHGYSFHSDIIKVFVRKQYSNLDMVVRFVIFLFGFNFMCGLSFLFINITF